VSSFTSGMPDRVQCGLGAIPHPAPARCPIRYSYVRREWPLSAYQAIFPRRPGSAEMPSASRPFSPQVVTRLVAYGVMCSPR
jgi:S-adenosylmethionine:tRNA ribosyltransferase-isomerase